MTTLVVPQPTESQPDEARGIRLAVTVALAIWAFLVVSLGSRGVFVGARGAPPVALGIAVAGPVILFWGWLRLSQSFREFVLSLDLRLVAGMQAWRWAGMGFLFLYAYRILPAVFALTAGLGDMAVGVTAPWIILALARRPGFVSSSAFVRWNLLGILDLVTAVSLGAIGAMFATGAPGEVSTTQMAMLPLLLIPGFLVPFFLMLHVTALLQIRQARQPAI